MNAVPMVFQCMDRQSAGLTINDDVLGATIVPDDVSMWTDSMDLWKVEDDRLPPQQEHLISIKWDMVRRRGCRG